MAPQRSRYVCKRFLATGIAVPLAVLWMGAVRAPSQSASSPKQSADELFVKEIRPLFEKQCLTCHSGAKPQSGLDLSTRDGILKGGSRGPAIVPGDPAGSL